VLPGRSLSGATALGHHYQEEEHMHDMITLAAANDMTVGSHPILLREQPGELLHVVTFQHNDGGPFTDLHRPGRNAAYCGRVLPPRRTGAGDSLGGRSRRVDALDVPRALPGRHAARC